MCSGFGAKKRGLPCSFNGVIARTGILSQISTCKYIGLPHDKPAKFLDIEMYVKKHWFIMHVQQDFIVKTVICVGV